MVAAPLTGQSQHRRPPWWPMPACATEADLCSTHLSVPLDILRNVPAQGLREMQGMADD